MGNIEIHNPTPKINQESGLFYKNMGGLWRVSDCEELGGGY